ncbi:MAG: hypothetical protein KAJ62_04045 [Desulfobacteraceae bacterium]|nr:hypothetical protein [Desulfobacteraceae bacterium]
MKRAAFLVLILVVCLFYSLSVFSASSTQNKTSDIQNTPSTTKVNPQVNNKTIIKKVNPQANKKTIIKKELPINIALEKKGKSLYVRLNRVPAKVDLFTHKKRLHTFMGKGKTRLNITPYLSKVRKNSITVFAYSTKGTKYTKTFSLSKYKLFVPTKIGATNKIISPVQGKSKKQSGFKRSKGPADTSRVMTEAFIPGGITLSVPAPDSTLERGTTIIVTYQFVRAMDHLPEEVEFRVVPRLSSMPGDLLETVRFGSESVVGDASASREVTLLLPFGLLEGGLYTINARSRRPYHSGKSNTFRIRTPEGVLGVYTPDSSDRFPPELGLNIPVEYSFHSGSTPARITIRIARELGGYNMELYSGPPLPSHSLPRPPDSWPGGDYRIVVNTDDGRIGYSQKFSLDPYRFSLISPIGGETFRTSYSPWWFRWHAEGSIDFVQAVLMKGGVEMYRWTPHINPPDHLLGDELIISPSQSWHPAGADYKLRIEGYRRHRGDSPTLVAVDESDRNFEVIDDWEHIPTSYARCTEHIPISIVEPARSGSSISWENNRTYPITWCVHDESVRNVNLLLRNASTDERWGIRMGAPNRFESSIFPGDRGYYGGSMDWTVPEVLPPGYYRLHIESTDGAYENTTFYGLNIRNWLIKGASPARSEVWTVGDVRDIEWESGGLSDQTVDIILRHWDGGRYEYQIADDVPNTGRFSWRILAEALPEGITRWENVYVKIIIDRHRTDSEFFTIAR